MYEKQDARMHLESAAERAHDRIFGGLGGSHGTRDLGGLAVVSHAAVSVREKGLAQGELRDLRLEAELQRFVILPWKKEGQVRVKLTQNWQRRVQFSHRCREQGRSGPKEQQTRTS